MVETNAGLAHPKVKRADWMLALLVALSLAGAVAVFLG